jgi:hypothetical protein
MSEDKQAQAEAWIRKKPKRIIQNQTLIILLMILAVGVPIPATGFLFYCVFCVAPSYVIPICLSLWAVCSVSYIVMRLHVERQNKKS